MGAIHLFTLAGIPVRVTYGFLLLVAYYAYTLSPGGITAVAGFLVAVVLSFLVHEFGHGLVARRYKLRPQIYLHGFGGLCAHEPAARDRHDVFIIAAGPLAGLAFAGVIAIAKAVLPASVFVSSTGLGWQPNFLAALFGSLWLINFYWSLVNLLPLFPLDGGQLFRLWMLRLVKPAAKAERIVHGLGIAIAGFGVVYGLIIQSLLLALFSGILLAQNIRYLSEGAPTRVRARSALVDQLLAQAREALLTGDPREARRLAYQARDERNVAEDQVQRAFEMLAVTSVRLEDWEEALDWAKRANATPTVDEAKVRALIGLGRGAEARHALAEARLPAEVAARLQAML